jgi:hypothetical protein
MQHIKISCQQCTHYQSCSLKTRMFVNYCGSRRVSVEQDIKTALLECRSKTTYFMRYHVLDSLTPAHALMHVPPVAA